MKQSYVFQADFPIRHFFLPLCLLLVSVAVDTVAATQCQTRFRKRNRKRQRGEREERGAFLMQILVVRAGVEMRDLKIEVEMRFV